jgi:hypothetical protein
MEAELQVVNSLYQSTRNCLRNVVSQTQYRTRDNVQNCDNCYNKYKLDISVQFRFTGSPWKFQTRNLGVRFDVFTVVTMKKAVFWDIMPRVSCKNRRFVRKLRLHHQGDKNQWRRYVSPKRRFLQESHCVTSQKTALFIELQWLFIEVTAFCLERY